MKQLLARQTRFLLTRSFQSGRTDGRVWETLYHIAPNKMTFSGETRKEGAVQKRRMQKSVPNREPKSRGDRGRGRWEKRRERGNEGITLKVGLSE